MVRGYLARSFDLLNVRDLDVVASANALCDELTVAVVDDETIARVSGRPPVVPLDERLAIVRHIRGPHQVIVHDLPSIGRVAEHTVFMVTGEPQLFSPPDEAVFLTSCRHSASRMICDALQSGLHESVA